MANNNVDIVLRIRDNASKALKGVTDESKKLDSSVTKVGNNKGFDKLKKSVDEFYRKLDQTGANFMKFGGLLSAGITLPIVAAGTAVLGLSNRMGALASDLTTLEAQTGLSTDTLQELNYTADVSGTTVANLRTSISTLTTNLRAGGEQSVRFTRALDAIGVSTRDANGNLRSMDDLFPEIISSLQDVEDGTTRNSLALQIFGGSANDLIPLLGMTSDEFRELREEAHELGVVLDRDALLAADDFRAEMARVRHELTALFQNLALDLIPTGRSLVDLFKTHLVPVIRSSADVVRGAVEWFNNLDITAQRGLITFLAIAAALPPLVTGIGAVMRAVTLLRTAFIALNATNPFGWVALAVTAVTGLAIALSGNRNSVDAKAKKAEEALGDLSLAAATDNQDSALKSLEKLRDSVNESVLPMLDNLIGKVGDTNQEFVNLAAAAEIAANITRISANKALIDQATLSLATQRPPDAYLDSLPTEEREARWREETREYIQGLLEENADLQAENKQLEDKLYVRPPGTTTNNTYGNAGSTSSGSSSDGEPTVDELRRNREGLATNWVSRLLWEVEQEDKEAQEVFNILEAREAELIEAARAAIASGDAAEWRHLVNLQETVSRGRQEVYNAFLKPEDEETVDPLTLGDTPETRLAQVLVDRSADIAEARGKAEAFGWSQDQLNEELHRIHLQHVEQAIRIGAETGVSLVDSPIVQMLLDDVEATRVIEVAADEGTNAYANIDTVLSDVMNRRGEAIEHARQMAALRNASEDELAEEISRINQSALDEALWAGVRSGVDLTNHPVVQLLNSGIQEAEVIVEQAEHGAAAFRSVETQLAQIAQDRATDRAEIIQLAQMSNWTQEEIDEALRGVETRAIGRAARLGAETGLDLSGNVFVRYWQSQRDALTQVVEEEDPIDPTASQVANQNLTKALQDIDSQVAVGIMSQDGAQTATRQALEAYLQEMLSADDVDFATDEGVQTAVAAIREMDDATAAAVELEEKYARAAETSKLVNEVNRAAATEGFTQAETQIYNLAAQVEALIEQEELLIELYGEESDAVEDLRKARAALEGQITRTKEAEAVRKQIEGYNEVSSKIGAVSGALISVSDAVGGVGNKASEMFSILTDGADTVLDVLGNIASGNWTAAIAGAVKGVVSLVQRLIDLFTPAWKKIARELEKELNASVRSALAGAFRDYLSGSTSMSEFLKAVERGVYSSVLDAIISAIVEAAIIEGTLADILKSISEVAAKGQWDVVAQYTRQAGQIAKDAASQMAPIVASLRQDFKNVMQDAEDGVSGIETRGTEFGEFVSAAISIPLYDASYRFSDATDRFVGATGRFSDVVDALIERGITVHSTVVMNGESTPVPMY